MPTKRSSPEARDGLRQESGRKRRTSNKVRVRKKNQNTETAIRSHLDTRDREQPEGHVRSSAPDETCGSRLIESAS